MECQYSIAEMTSYCVVLCSALLLRCEYGRVLKENTLKSVRLCKKLIIIIRKFALIVLIFA